MPEVKKPNKPIITRKELVIVSAFFGFILILLIITFYSPNYYKNTEPVEIDIAHGSTLSQVIDSLYARKIIPNKMNMKIIAYLYGAEKKIKAGRYNIPNGLNYIKLVELLINGSPAAQILVTLPEGIWQTEVAQILKNNLHIDSAKVMELSKSRSFLNYLDLDVDNLEGYLMPESYYFYSNSSAEEILKKLKDEMDKFFTPKITARMKELRMTKNQILTLASIIDGESNLVSEFKTISGVYYNRLKIGMPLQADPTVQYLIRDKHKNRIFKKDLQIDSRFNTYKYYGLPPAPINNPGKDAIRAALYPEKNNYLYFVANGNGGHIFSKTNNEHELNVSRYRQWRRNQN
ncbi:MAG: endolytic transglycosylase MltG [Ignavibacteriales bacterium]|nr:endolytic transglycosylase MltG [Ignavibacteriales bacterium]